MKKQFYSVLCIVLATLGTSDIIKAKYQSYLIHNEIDTIIKQNKPGRHFITSSNTLYTMSNGWKLNPISLNESKIRYNSYPFNRYVCLTPSEDNTSISVTFED